VYELTEWGKELEPVIQALGRFGARSPQMPRGAGMSPDSAILALRTMFDADAAGDLRADFELRLGGDDRFRAELSGSRLELARGEVDGPDAIVETDPSTLVAVAFGRRSLADATRAGDMRVDGDRAAVKRVFRLFSAPAPAAAA
jgi:alkyl sulfatase BDS1-like metallo-beta-lactamase superfamily hydrolase